VPRQQSRQQPQHISRQELKEDEFVSSLDSAYEYYLQHQKSVITTAIAVAIVIAIGVSAFYWNRSRNQKASALLSQALQLYHAPLQTPGQPAQPNVQTYASEHDRAVAAQKVFRQAAESYGGTSAGKFARYYLGLTQVELGDNAGAENTLRAAASSGNDNVSALAKQALADLYVTQGKVQQAQSLLRELINKPTDTVPKAESMLALAAAERDSNPADATKLYSQIKAEFPDSQTAQAADRELASLRK
jgi:predicted negative regulator of RcsB-dependent stress response